MRTRGNYFRVEYRQNFHQWRLCWANRHGGDAGNTFDIGRDTVVPGRELAGWCSRGAAAKVDGARSLTRGFSVRCIDYEEPSTSFHENIYASIIGEGLEVLPTMDDGSGIDLRNSFENSGFEFLQRLHSDMP